MHKGAWLLGSLAPALACLVLVFANLSPGARSSVGQAQLVGMIVSNQNYAAYASDNFRETQNRLSSITFDWTNRNVSTSSIAPF
jgi:hypothetical protein